MLIGQVDFSHVRVINKETLFNDKKISFYCFFTAVYCIWLGMAFSHILPG